jgi:hypothetical protein
MGLGEMPEGRARTASSRPARGVSSLPPHNFTQYTASSACSLVRCGLSWNVSPLSGALDGSSVAAPWPLPLLLPSL